MLPPLSKTATFGNPDSSYKNPPDVLNVYVAGRRIDENYQIAPTFFIYQSFISPLDAFQVASAIIGPKKHIAVFFDFSERTADGQIFTRHFISQDGGPFQEIREDRLLGSVVPYLGDYDEAINTPPATPIVVTVFNSEGITKKIRAPFLESKLWGNRILSQHSFSDPTEAFTFAKSQTQPERLVMIGFLFDEKSERGVPFQRTFLSWDDEPFQEVINSSFRDQAVPYLGKFTSYLPPLSKTAEYEKEETSQPITEVWVSENKEVSPYLQDRLDLKRSFPDPLLAFRYAKTLTQPNFLIYVVPMFYERVFNEKYRCDEVIRRLFISRNDQDFEETQGIRHDEDLPILPYQGDLVQLAKTAHHLPPLSKNSGTLKDMEDILRSQRFIGWLREHGATDEQIRKWERDEDWDDELLQDALNEEQAFYAGNPLQRNIKYLPDNRLVFFFSFPRSVVPPLTAAERSQIHTELQNRDIIVEDFDPRKTYEPWQKVLYDSSSNEEKAVVWYRSADFFEPRKEEWMEFPKPLQHLLGYVPHPDEPTEASSIIPLHKTAALPTPNIPNEWFELSSQHHPLLPPPTEEIRVYIRHDLERNAETHTFESLDAAYQFAESLDPNTKLIRIERTLGREPKYSDLTDEIEAQLLKEYQKTNQPIPLGATLDIEYKKWVDQDWTATASLATFFFTAYAGLYDNIYPNIRSYLHLPGNPPVRTSSSLPLFNKNAYENSTHPQTPTRVRICQIDPKTETLGNCTFEWFEDPHQAFAWARAKTQLDHEVKVEFWFDEETENGKRLFRTFTSMHDGPFIEEIHPEGDSSTYVSPYLGKFTSCLPPLFKLANEEHDTTTKVLVSEYENNYPLPLLARIDLEKIFPDPHLAFAYAKSIAQPNIRVVVSPRFSEKGADGQIIYRYWASDHGEDFIETVDNQTFAIRPTITYLGDFSQIAKISTISIPILLPLSKTASKTWQVEWEWNENEPTEGLWGTYPETEQLPEDLKHPTIPNLRVPACKRSGKWIVVNHTDKPLVSRINPWFLQAYEAPKPEPVLRYMWDILEQSPLDWLSEGDEILINTPVGPNIRFIAVGEGKIEKVGSQLPPLTKQAASLPTLNIPQEWYEASSYTHPALPLPTEKIAVLYKTPDLTTNVDYLDFESLQQAHNYAESLDPETPWIIISHTLGLYFPEVYSKSPTISKDIPSSATQVPLSAELKVQYVKGKEDEDWKAQATFNRFTLESDANYRLMVQYNYPDINAEPTRYVVGIL